MKNAEYNTDQRTFLSQGPQVIDSSFSLHRDSYDTHRNCKQLRMQFNPTRVRLKRSCPSISKSRDDGLQPHKGSSETHASDVCSNCLRLFDPTRVRLKHLRSNRPIVRGIFNPTRVRLKLLERFSGRDDDERFNPTRVRLKHPSDALARRHDRASTPQGFV